MRAILLWPALAAACVPLVRDEPALTAQTAALPHTTLVATRSAPLDPATNQLWCAPMALAWEELGRALGGDVQVEPPSATAARLSAEPFPRADLDPEAYVAFASAQPDEALARLRSAQRRGGFEPDPDFGRRLAGLEGGLSAYAQLAKALRFPTRFEDLPYAALAFRKDLDAAPTVVDAFGIGSFDLTERPHKRLREQVAIHETDDRSAYALVLSTDQGDRVVLARVEPGASLDATWAAAAALVADREPEQLGMGDSLWVPELDFALRHDYVELEGLTVRNGGFAGRTIGFAVQDLRLRLDEEGLVVRSRAQLGVTSAPVTGPRTMHFDRPFLLAAIEAEAETPYLVAWIADPELMQPVQGG